MKVASKQVSEIRKRYLYIAQSRNARIIVLRFTCRAVYLWLFSCMQNGCKVQIRFPLTSESL